MRLTDELLLTYRGLVNTVSRPDHMSHFHVTRRVAEAVAVRSAPTPRARAAALFVAKAEVLAEDGVLTPDDVEHYTESARHWAWDYGRASTSDEPRFLALQQSGLVTLA